MRAMKDSGIEWIGKIPEEWDVRKIKHCFNVYAGATPKSGNSEFWDGDVVWVTPADYTTEQKYISQGKKNITQSGFESCSTEMIPAGSLIFSKRAPIGLVAINTVDLCTNQGCLSCVPLDENDVEYFYYAFSCFTVQFDLYGSGTTFKEISADAFVNFPIPCPSLETQQGVSEYLRSRCAEIDALIAAKEKTNALLKERRQSIIYEAVTKGLNPDAPMKDSGIEWIGEIPEHWSVGKTIYGLEMPITDGPHETPQLYSEGVPFVSAEAVSCGNGRIDFDHIRGYISEAYYDECCKKYIPRINDIYMIKSGATTGKVAIVDTDRKFTIWSPLAVFRCLEDKCYYKYLFYFLQSDAYQKQVESKWSFGTQQNIGMRTLERLMVCFPTIDEQKCIADYLDDRCSETDRMILANEVTIQKLKEYRQSVIYEAVTGKIEV